MELIIVHIALPVPMSRLFSYAIPPALLPSSFFLAQNSLSLEETTHSSTNHIRTEILQKFIGCRALVPFGKRVLTGVIVEIPKESSKKSSIVPEEKLKEIIELLDEQPAFSPLMLKFTKWVADYYVTSWGETLKTALPQGMSPETTVRVVAAHYVSEEEITKMERKAPRRAAILRELQKRSAPISVKFLEEIFDGVHVASALDALADQGLVRLERTLEEEAQAKTLKAVRLPTELLADHDKITAILDELESRAPKQSLVFAHCVIHAQHSSEPIAQRELAEATDTSTSVIKSLIEKGVLEEVEIEVVRREISTGSLAVRNEAEIVLSMEQEHCLAKISEALSAQLHKTFLIHGVTGSGKTLVYMQAIKHVLASGKTALLLLPEISLTPQMIDRFTRAFGDDVVAFHSKMSLGERFDAWRLVRTQRAKIVIGARSAIFAPLMNIGIIIVDEEHDASYKQDDPSPRYNARDCAIIRGSMEHCVVVLGSATPSLETMFNAQSGKFHLLEISSRADGAVLPAISVVNTVQARKNRSIEGVFSHELLAAIGERIYKREGVIIFHNRRGFASFFECKDCGTVAECPECSVSLTYHKFSERLRCHYCGYSREAERACRTCGSLEIRDGGAGTQRVEEELEAALKIRGIEARIVRMDLDTTSRKGSHRKMLEDFASGEIDILLGTQMVTKGIDFARVTLVGVVNADMQLFMPDFRARERTFQVLTQVSGRAGRSGEFPGEVIIQTADPMNQAILATMTHHYEHFYNDEIQSRKELWYPPFARFSVVRFSGRDERHVVEHANHFASLLPRTDEAFLRLGPAVPTIARLRSEYRRVVVIKNFKNADPSGARFRHFLLHALSVYSSRYASSHVRVTIDIDAQGFI